MYTHSQVKHNFSVCTLHDSQNTAVFLDYVASGLTLFTVKHNFSVYMLHDFQNTAVFLDYVASGLG